MVETLVQGALGAFGASKQAAAAKAAAAAQERSIQQALAETRRQYDNFASLMQPWAQRGGNAADILAQLTGANPGGNPLTAFLTKEFQPTDLENTPGYRFILDQGTKAAQNGFAAKGLGSSGAAIKGGVDYAKGLADSTYNTQLSNDMQQRQLIWNMLFPQAQAGEQAASAIGGAGMSTGKQVSDLFTGGGNVAAGGIIGQTKPWTDMIGGISGNLATQSYIDSMRMAGIGPDGKPTGQPSTYQPNIGTRIDNWITKLFTGSQS